MRQLPKATVMILSLLLGGSILWLAAANTLSAFTLVDSEPLRLRLQQHQDLGAEQLLVLNDAQRASLDWYWTSLVHQDLVSTELSLAKTIDDQADKEIWAVRAERSLEAGLLRSPADPTAWARLSFMRLQNGAHYYGAREALIMSLLTGPFERPLVFSRIAYGIRLWDQLSKDEQSLIRDQITMADRFDRRRLTRMARQHRTAMKIIVSSMAEDLDRFAGFIRALNR